MPLQIIGRRNFQWKVGTPVYDWRAKLPADGRIVPVDRALAERLDRECYPVPFIRFDWGSYEAYTQHGFGFALFIGEAIASRYTISVSFQPTSGWLICQAWSGDQCQYSTSS